MPKHLRAFEDAASAARNARTIAVKAAKEALNTMIVAAQVEAVERAWTQYDVKINQIWEAYYGAMGQAQSMLDEARQGERKLRSMGEQSSAFKTKQNSVAAAVL